MSDENLLTQTQIRRNAGSAASWQIAEPHRRRVTHLTIDKRFELTPTLCVLGAGHCNDLDLQELLGHFQCIELVDIDDTALQAGISDQRLDSNERLKLHGNRDLTGIWPELAALGSLPTDQEIDQLLAKSNTWSGLSGLGNFGTVISACMLSQLVDSVISTLGESHPRCLQVITAIRQRHLLLLYELVVSGGNAILITDFVSSDTAPQLPSLTGEAFSNMLLQMLKEQNFFTGLNPFRLQKELYNDKSLAGKIESIHCETPWLWDFGPRHYAVTAISFRKI